MRLWAFVNQLLELAGVPQIPAWPVIPYPLARQAAAAIEGAYRLAQRRDEPPFTRLLVAQLAHTRTFNLSAARRDLGYSPHISTAEGMKRTVAALHGH